MSVPTREERLFAEALALTESERDSFLANACADDNALRESIEGLLEAHQAAGTVLDASPIVRPASREEMPGDVIGRYKLVQKIGEGGYGVVYMAEQTEPVRRRVAVKVIKLGMDTKTVVARFDAERQALALMDHANIAKVFDGGATENGRPYFVMELVGGVPITRYCDENALTTEQRIRLFAQVCHAIQHAHQKGVIHRDIKPSNILVTLHDTEPVPKVIDFGIAKATQGRLTEQTLFTAFENFIGTPAYTSPEQANFADLDIDTRSDVYSLGVLLYELLTGRTPFDHKRLAQAGLEEIRRHIREIDPPRPSTCLSTMDGEALSTAARQRQIAAPKLIHLLRGDLDWIVMRCLEKDRRRRYETASDLAKDLERHLNDEPVTARPPTAAYRLRKTAQRHKLAVAAVCAVAVATLAGFSAVLWAFINEKTARNVAAAAEHTAVSEAKKSEEIARLLQAMLEGIGPSVALGRDTTLLREIADNATARIDKDLANQPAVEAALRETLGKVYFDLGNFDRAKAMHNKVLKLHISNHGASSVETARSLRNMGTVEAALGNLEVAESLLQRSVALQRAKKQHETLEFADTISDLAEVLLQLKESPRAEAEQRSALSLHRRLAMRQPIGLARSLSGLALSERAQGSFDSAHRSAAEALSLQMSLRGVEHPETSRAMYAVASIHFAKGNLDEAERVLREVLATQTNILGIQHPDTGLTSLALAGVLNASARYQEAERIAESALNLHRQLYSPSHIRIADSLRILGNAQASLFKRDAALMHLKQAYDIYHHISDDDTFELADTLTQLAIVSLVKGNIQESTKYIHEVLTMRTRMRDPQISECIKDLCYLLKLSGRWSEAIHACEQQITLYAGKYGNDDRLTLVLKSELSSVYHFAGEYEIGLRFAKEAAVQLETLVGTEDWDTAFALKYLGDLHWALGDFEKAESACRRALAIATKKGGPAHLFSLWVSQQLGLIYRDAGRLEDASLLATNALSAASSSPDAWRIGPLALLGEIRLLQGRFDEAAEPLLHILSLMDSFGSIEWTHYNVQSLYGAALIGSKQYAEAETKLIEAYEGLNERYLEVPVPFRYRVTQAAERLAQLYSEIGMPDMAAQWNERVEELRAKASAANRKGNLGR